ncbi:MAG TPA: hypothetical protein VH280_21400 [Verrucomicrobiae bacterium]|jgi:hypothetical protein|nr:hypothetical protein [Verrucomicrobiae bacterium]
MKTKLLLTAALIGAVSLSAHAAVYGGFSFGRPAARVVVTAPAPVVVAPVVETVPACPGPGYTWVAGYWSGYGTARVWVGGCWKAPVHVVYTRPVDRHGDHGDRGYDRRR